MSYVMKKVIIARCVECDSRIFFQEKPELGFIVTCNQCDTRLEVVELDPVELDWGDEEFNDDYDDEANH